MAWLSRSRVPAFSSQPEFKAKARCVSQQELGCCARRTRCQLTVVASRQVRRSYSGNGEVIAHHMLTEQFEGADRLDVVEVTPSEGHHEMVAAALLRELLHILAHPLR